jgi:signal transduction histidine kinase
VRVSEEPERAPAGSLDAAEAAVLELLREIRRDVAHELRGTVQSVVVNTEVTRRRLAAGDTEGVAERVEVVESEVRRMHGVTDALLSLLRPPPFERRVFDVGSVLELVEPLLLVLARTARSALRMPAAGSAPLVRSRPEALALALVRLARSFSTLAGVRGDVALERRVEPSTVNLILTATGGPPLTDPDPWPGLERAILAARLWLADGDGTVEHLPGSDPLAPGPVRIRLPRADIA